MVTLLSVAVSGQKERSRVSKCFVGLNGALYSTSAIIGLS